MTDTPVRSNAPGEKSLALGYWNVPGPLSSPVGIRDREHLGARQHERVDVVLRVAGVPALVAVTVIVVVPKLVATGTDQLPDAVGRRRRDRGDAARGPDAPRVDGGPGRGRPGDGHGAPMTLAPGVGEVIVTGNEPGIPLVT